MQIPGAKLQDKKLPVTFYRDLEIQIAASLTDIKFKKLVKAVD
jgi:hypothetical protein